MIIALYLATALVALIMLIGLFALPAIAVAHFGLGEYPALRVPRNTPEEQTVVKTIITETMKPPGMPFLITNAQKDALRQRGFTDGIANMTPMQVHAILAKPVVTLPGLSIPEGYVQPKPPRDNWLRQGDSYQRRDT